MGKTAQRKRSMFELGVSDGRKHGRPAHYYVGGRKDMVNAHINGVKAGISKPTPSYSPDYADGANYGALAFESDINIALWEWIKRVVTMGVVVFLALVFFGCSTHTISITPQGVNATSTAMIYCPEAKVIRVMDGNRTVDMVGESAGVGEAVTEVLKP